MTAGSTSAIWMIDDNLADRRFTQIMLKKEGIFPVMRFLKSAQEALAHFEDPAGSRAQDPEGFPPCVVLLDINMPGMDGFGLLDALCSRWATRPEGRCPFVILLTSSHWSRDRARAQTYDCVEGYLSKPISSENIQWLWRTFCRSANATGP